MLSETAILGGGCFWCTEAVFENVEGVSGYFWICRRMSKNQPIKKYALVNLDMLKS